MISGSDEAIRDCFRISIQASLATSSPWYCNQGGAICQYRKRCEELDGRGDPGAGQDEDHP